MFSSRKRRAFIKRKKKKINKNILTKNKVAIVPPKHAYTLKSLDLSRRES